LFPPILRSLFQPRERAAQLAPRTDNTSTIPQTTTSLEHQPLASSTPIADIAAPRRLTTPSAKSRTGTHEQQRQGEKIEKDIEGAGPEPGCRTTMKKRAICVGCDRVTTGLTATTAPLASSPTPAAAYSPHRSGWSV